MAERSSGLSDAARAFPPLSPPRRPSATAAGFFRFGRDEARGDWPVAAATTFAARWLASSGLLLLLERFGMFECTSLTLIRAIMTKTPRQSQPEEFANITSKLGRAHEHIEAFNSAAQEFWSEPNIYRAIADTDRRRRGVYRLVEVKNPPVDLSLHIGEAAHQMRSSLDHLMWMLAQPSPGKENQVSFPIVDSLFQFRGKMPRRKVLPRNPPRAARHQMPGVQRGVRTVIESIQPYHSRAWPETRALAQLRDISNWDKHRALITAAAGLTIFEPNLTLGDGIRLKKIETFRRVLKPGAILARFEVENGPVGAEMKMKPEIEITPQFDERAPTSVRGQSVVPLLRSCLSFLAGELMPRFFRFF
jgi:hypothetical protein